MEEPGACVSEGIELNWAEQKSLEPHHTKSNKRGVVELHSSCRVTAKQSLLPVVADEGVEVKERFRGPVP